jgi:hypothetical protein
MLFCGQGTWEFQVASKWEWSRHGANEGCNFVPAKAGGVISQTLTDHRLLAPHLGTYTYPVGHLV